MIKNQTVKSTCGYVKTCHVLRFAGSCVHINHRLLGMSVDMGWCNGCPTIPRKTCPMSQVFCADVLLPPRNVWLQEAWSDSKFSRQIVRYESAFCLLCSYEKSQTFLSIQKPERRLSPHEEPWQSHDRLLLFIHPLTPVTLCLSEGITLLFSAPTQHTAGLEVHTLRPDFSCFLGGQNPALSGSTIALIPSHIDPKVQPPPPCESGSGVPDLQLGSSQSLPS